jgi:hypothetical protein
MNTMMTAIAISSTTVLLVVASGIGVAARAGADAPRPGQAPAVRSDRRAETRRILSTLDSQVADPMVRRRVADKLLMLSDGRVHLIAALAERLAVDGDNPAARFALLLITALLIAS